MGNPLLQLRDHGQSVWYDNVRRGLITSGEFQKMVDGDGVAGVTSNPTIFEKAIAGSTDYDADIKELVAQGKGTEDVYLALVIRDIQLAADILRPRYDETEGRDGLACLEVSPLLAYDTQASIESARMLWKALDRPNVMVKIPGTPQGLPAIEQCLSEGININITLLFGVENYERVAWAYIKALEQRAARGEGVDRMASVASFFVSRVDSLVDKLLEGKLRAAESAKGKQRLEPLLGRAGIANAKIAYAKFKEIFGGDRFRALAAKGARVQRCLWASTSTKNPHYRDVMYVEGLLGPDTVNTMPQATLDAFRDHGELTPQLEAGLDEAQAVMRELAEVGIDFAAVTEQLQKEGVELFADSYRKLIGCLDEKREALLSETAGRFSASFGEYGPRVEDALRQLQKDDFARRLWAKDPSLWSADENVQKAIKQRLGWLTVTEAMAEHCDQLQAFAQEVREAGYQKAVLLGMGGSSLAPEVCRRTIDGAPGHPQLELLDTTDPQAILACERSLDPARTLFIVSSKSGTTPETVSLYAYFREKVRAAKGDRLGESFIAITDPGTPLERTARGDGFRRCFLNPTDVGGRFSALSYFGLVPAAVMGLDVAKLLDRAEAMVQGCASCVPPPENPGVWLGAALGELARAGRDKVTFVAGEGLAAFGAWAEQLLAESTGKDGRGLIPIDGEPLGEARVYGDDRVFVHIGLDSAGDSDGRLKALAAAGHPVLRLRLSDTYDLGQEFFRWEVAIATAGALLGINPFDEPGVQESKDNTARLLADYAREGRLPQPEPDLIVDDEAGSAVDRLAPYLRQARTGDYVALVAYLQPSPEHDERLQAIRLALRDSLKLATTLGYGPRFLHSTGQLHKGGPDSGLLIQLTADDAEDPPVPDQPYGFATLKRAQALGDLQSLRDKGRRVLWLHLGADIAGALARLEEAVKEALA